MSYDKALEAMEAYTSKELGSGAYMCVVRDNMEKAKSICCAIGAIAPSTRNAGNALVCNLSTELFRDVRSLGLTESEARELQVANDKFGGSPSKRYEYIVAWLKERV